MQAGGSPEGVPPAQQQAVTVPGHLLRISSEQLQRAAQGLELEVEVEADQDESMQVGGRSGWIGAGGGGSSRGWINTGGRLKGWSWRLGGG